MWIGSQKNDEKPLGISQPIKVGVFFTYDQSLFYGKNFQD